MSYLNTPLCIYSWWYWLPRLFLKSDFFHVSKILLLSNVIPLTSSIGLRMSAQIRNLQLLNFNFGTRMIFKFLLVRFLSNFKVPYSVFRFYVLNGFLFPWTNIYHVYKCIYPTPKSHPTESQEAHKSKSEYRNKRWRKTHSICFFILKCA